MNTQENIIIAEYLGFQKTNIGWFDNEEILSGENNTFDILKFDVSYDWLIPALNIITNKIDYRFFDTWKMLTNPSNYDIKYVHEQLVEYVKQAKL